MKKYIISSAFAVLLILVFITCKKETETPTGSNKIEIGQTQADSVSYFYSQVKTTVSDLNGNTIKEHGHCWSTSQNPSIEDDRTQLGALNQAATFSSELKDLEDNTQYYVRFYLSMENGTVYGEDIVLTTLKAGVPVVETSPVSNIDLYSASLQGTVLSDSGVVVQSKGFCWDIKEDFSIEDCIDTTINGAGLGSFSSKIGNLSEVTTYYVKSYAINAKGVSYSQIESFTTVAITLPGLRTIAAEDITNNQATINAEVLNNGLGSITARGVCWHTQAEFDLDNNSGFNIEEGDLGEFSSTVTGLTENTTYYVKAFATNVKGTAYGETIEFNTAPISIPEVSTLEISDITINSAVGGGIVNSDGYSNVNSRGVVWSTNENPTIENNDGITIDGEGMGEFSSQLSNLSDGTIYFVRAYAKNEIGTAYGSSMEFSTLNLELPSVSTNEISNIGTSFGTCGGNVNNDGNGSIATRGVCWNTTGNPTLNSSLGNTSNGNGLGVFICNISGLDDNTTYYVAAYATNEAGTAYGNIRIFTTLDATPCDGEITFTYQGQVYDILEIGTQCWMKENLNVGTRINGNQEMQYNGIIEKYCCYDYETMCDIYGGLYQWDEMMQYTTIEGTQGICPNGWHIPSDDEWTILTDFLGGAAVAGGKMKETGYEHWDFPNTGATNSSGFTALPGGFRRYDGDFFSNEQWGDFWSSNQSGTDAWNRTMGYEAEFVGRYNLQKTNGYSVRCIKD